MELPTGQRPRSQFFLELLLSLNTGFAGMSMFFCAMGLSGEMPFIRLEVYLNHLFHIRQTDYVRGYFAIWIPSLAIALCILTLFRLSRHLSITKSSLRFVAGMTVFLSPCAIWTCAYEHIRWSLDWPYKLIWGEAALAVLCLWVFLKARWAIGKWIGISAFVAHSLFWYFFLSGTLNGLNWGIPHYAGPAGLLLGTSAAFAWELYIWELRQVRN